MEELYDVRGDPSQVNNLSQDPKFAAVKQQLWRQLRERLESSGDPRINGEDPWKDYVYRQTIGFGATFNESNPPTHGRRAQAEWLSARTFLWCDRFGLFSDLGTLAGY